MKHVYDMTKRLGFGSRSLRGTKACSVALFNSCQMIFVHVFVCLLLFYFFFCSGWARISTPKVSTECWEINIAFVFRQSTGKLAIIGNGTRNHLSLLFGFEVTSGGRGGGDALSHSTSLHARINDRCKQANAVTAYFGFQLSLCGYRSSNKNSSESAEEIPFLFSKRHVQPLIFSPHVSNSNVNWFILQPSHAWYPWSWEPSAICANDG